MSVEILFVFGLIGVVAALMASGKVRYDLVALIVLLALMLSGILSPAETLSGFGSTVVINVAGLLIVGHMLDRTGVANAIGDTVLKQGGSSETRLLILIMIGAAGLGAVMSSTAVVAIFIPIVLRIARECNLNASRLLMPMSYAALISGMLTLIASAPNLVVSGELRDSGYAPFGFFSFTLVGLAVLAVAITYMLLFGRTMLSSKEPETSTPKAEKRSILGLLDDFLVDRELRQLTVNADSSLIGMTMAQIDFQNSYGVLISGVKRKQGASRWLPVDATTEIVTGDTLVAVGKNKELDRMQEETSLSRHVFSKSEAQRRYWEIGAATILIHPESTLIGKSLSELEFRNRYGLQVFGLRREGQPVDGYEELKLKASDSLLVVGPWRRIQVLQSMDSDFVMLELPAEKATVVPEYTKMPIALGILGVMVLLSVFNVVPLVTAVIMAGIAAVFTRCLTMEDAYGAIHWKSLVLVAGMLPLADALEKTGGTQVVVDGLMDYAGITAPYLMMSVLFFLTAALGMFLPTTASAVLVAPIAISSAETLGVSPYPFALAVLIAASSAFMTPVSTPVVSLVVEPGRYRFIDFIKVGVPMLLLTYLVTMFLVPVLFPLSVP